MSAPQTFTDSKPHRPAPLNYKALAKRFPMPSRRKIVEAAPEDAPILQSSQRRIDWQVVIFGGKHPRTGHKQQALNFNFPALYSASKVRQRALDLCASEYRTHFAVLPPADFDPADHWVPSNAVPPVGAV